MFKFQIDKIGQHHILHDDTIIGGTKRRALNFLLSAPNRHCEAPKATRQSSSNMTPQNSGLPHSFRSFEMTDDVFYAGTTMGHGALALAHSCMDNNKAAHIFISGDEENLAIQKLRQTNAKLYLQPPLPITTLYDMASMAAKEQNTIALPPAFDMQEFEDAMVAAFKDFDVSPYSEIWTCAVTGTLTRALQRAFPHHSFKTVKVAKAECNLGRSEIFHAPEKYHHPAKSPPPYPSCPHTDAKIWQFAYKYAEPNALIWNTAG